MLELVHQSAFYQVAALLLLAAVIGFIGNLLRQPLIVSFIAVGVLAGPSILGIVQAEEHIDVLAELGIAVLLFLVGLKLDLKLIRTLGPVALTTGLGQVIFTSVVGYGIALALGLQPMTALYVAVALTFSSTIIIVKLLSDKHEVDSLHGRIALGFLIVQDLVVILAMMVLSALGMGTAAGDDPVLEIVSMLASGLMIIMAVALFVRYVATPLMRRLARSPELLTTFAISWAALLAVLGDTLGFSKELGGLLAGISLASTPVREALISRLSSLRDFLLLFFFIALGARLELDLLGAQIVPAVVLSLFVLVGNPLIVMVIMGLMGYRKRTSFLAGLTVAQISEFSLIFMAMGLNLGHVTEESLGLVTLVGLTTIALSVYMITYSHALYAWLEPVLSVFERRMPYREEDPNSHNMSFNGYDFILFGLGRYGSAIAHNLLKNEQKLLVVDFNPDAVRRWRALGHDAVYGDASDPNFIAMLPLHSTRWVVSAMQQHDVGLALEDPRYMLIHSLKEQGFGGRIAVATHHNAEIDILLERGAHLVFRPYQDAADRAVEKMQDL